MSFDFSKLSVLVVEDTAPIRNLIESVLDAMGVGKVETASNGEEAYEKFRKNDADVVLTDWEMAPMDGIELTKIIRTDQMSPNRIVPVILVTGYSAPERVAEARDAGVTEYIVKPFSADDIAKRLAYTINKPRDFIESGDYFGPDRRRKIDPHYEGPFRRNDDKQR